MIKSARNKKLPLQAFLRMWSKHRFWFFSNIGVESANAFIEW